MNEKASKKIINLCVFLSLFASGALFNIWFMETFLKVGTYGSDNYLPTSVIESALGGLGFLMMKITLPIAALINYALNLLTPLSAPESNYYSYYVSSGLLFGLCGLAMTNFILRRRAAQK